MDEVVKLVFVCKSMPPMALSYQETVPADEAAIKVTVPVPILAAGVVLVIVGVNPTVVLATLLVVIAFPQFCVAIFVIVIVVDPELAKGLVEKAPVPAVGTLIVAVLAVSLFAPVKL